LVSCAGRVPSADIQAHLAVAMEATEIERF
jgi:hypothetical protein